MTPWRWWQGLFYHPRALVRGMTVVAVTAIVGWPDVVRRAYHFAVSPLGAPADAGKDGARLAALVIVIFGLLLGLCPGLRTLGLKTLSASIWSAALSVVSLAIFAPWLGGASMALWLVARIGCTAWLLWVLICALRDDAQVSDLRHAVFGES